MKRALNIASALIATLGAVILFYVLSPKKVVHSSPSAAAFSGFPVDHHRTIELTSSDDAIRQLSRREYSDQIKDWLLTTVVFEAGLSPSDLNQALFDLPPVRYGYIRPVGAFEYGDTRSRSIGNSRVVALIPKANVAGRLDALAQIADEARKNTGDKPTTLLTFEYEISPDHLSAEVTRRADVEGVSLFTEPAGYFETTVDSLENLRSFMARIDDLTYARLEPAGLRLGGRKVHSHRHHDISVDDAAALWSAQTKLRTRNGEFERFVADKQQQFDARWSGRHYRYEYERVQLEAARDADLAQIEAAIDRERERLGVVSHTGFSLDPSFVYSKVKSELNGKLGSVMVTASNGRIFPADVDRAADDAGIGKLESFYSLLQKVDKDVARGLALYLKTCCGYQAARYDGALKGTEVGMVLFYTDLLAKLWALDYVSSAPDSHIPDFRSMSHTILSPIYAREFEVLPSTRLWFGVQPRGFSQQDDGVPSLMLAPVATRLYAASSDSITPGKEVAPNAASAAFLGWWDDHYEEVARFEPEYERLNEIMKWSILISWLDDKGKLDALSPLQQVSFRTDNWFPDWVRTHPDLRFQRWDRIQFYPHDFAKTEALPLLQSDESVPIPLRGGVSLAERELFQARGAISKDIAEFARRPTLKWSETTPDIFRTVEDAEFKFARSADRYTVDAALKAGTKFRAVDAEVADLHYSRAIEFGKSAIRMDVADASAPIGELKIERAANSFHVSWQSREFDTATSLARKLSAAGDPELVLGSDPRVAALVQIGDGEFLVQLRGSSRWLKMAPERELSATIPEGWQSRVASLDPHAKSIDLAWFSDEKAAAELGGNKFVRIPTTASQSDAVRMEVVARLPPAAADTNIRVSGRDLHVQRDSATGDYYIRWADLPQDIRDHPALLRGLSGRESGGAIPPSFDELAAGDFRWAANELAHDPLAFKAALDLHYVSGLKDVDALLAHGNDAQALHALEQLSHVHGETPDITLRKAIALTRGDGSRRVADALDGTVKTPIGNRIALFDEINARIRNAQTAAEQDDLLQLAAFGDWNDLRTTGVLRDGQAVATVEKGKLQIEYHASRPFKATPVSDLPSGEATIYVQDTPALSNLDTPAAIQQSMLHAGVQGRLPAVVRLNDREIANFRPAKIYMDDGKTALRKVETGRGTHAARQVYRAYNSLPCSGQDHRPECTDQQPVYLVMDSAEAARLH